MRNLPTKWRKTKHIAWMYCLLKEVELIHSEFITFIASIRNQLSYNGQIISLEDLLNTFYPAASGNIQIINTITDNVPVFINEAAESSTSVYVNQKDESPSTDIFIFSASEFNVPYDFTIKVPDTLVFDNNQMRALVNKFKLSGKRFNIITYTV